MSKYLLVLTTLPTEELARQLAAQLVEQKLAACINILPAMTSIYQWQGKLEQGTEHQMLIKTRQDCYAQLEKFILAQHPYELPEIIAVPITQGLPEYLQWISDARTS
ncbi:MAG: divalent-cation tolerance protein CutA [Gammaproteobacteria bacterium]|nr:divalent-cation tolerance protein CutA [Gammaproteobacteria bacterium]